MNCYSHLAHLRPLKISSSFLTAKFKKITTKKSKQNISIHCLIKFAENTN